MDRPQPHATVTMLFSDIEGSTALLARLGPRYAEVLEAHKAILRDAWMASGGTELGTEGDSFFVRFPGAIAGVTAAVAAQRGVQEREWPDGIELRIRIGLHTGEPMEQADGLVGMDVHRAARIAASAHGGQIVLSDATRALVAGHLPTDVHLVDLGEHRLKDLAEPERLSQLNVDGLLQDFPPLRTLGTASSLPETWTQMVGRDRELRVLREVLDRPRTRLVTIIGPGGCGKTRIAIELATLVTARFADGVHFVPLATVEDAVPMWAAIAVALNVPTGEDRRLATLEYVKHRRALVVLDNLEQITTADHVVGEILEGSSGVTILATSRRPLHVMGEQEFHLGGLPTTASTELEALARSDAVRLFCQHAQLSRPEFVLDTSNAADIGELCRRLDGLPLAIELVAAGTSMLSPSALLRRFDAVTRSDSTVVGRPNRHRSLHSAIAWSYGMLSPESQVALRRLSVFAGGAHLRAVQAVVANDRDPLATVTELVDASLATIKEQMDGEPRLTLLQTISDFGRDRLHDAGETPVTRDRHARHFLTFATAHVPRMFTGEQLRARERLEDERANFRAALEWCLGGDAARGHEWQPEPNRVLLGARLASQLWWFWARTGSAPDGQAWLERAVALLPSDDGVDYAGALLALGSLLSGEEREEGREKLEQALAIFRAADDQPGIAQTLTALGWPYGSSYTTTELRAMLEESIAISTDLGDEAAPSFARAIYRLGEVESIEDHPEAAIANFSRARDLARRRGDEILSVGMQDVLTAAMLRSDDLEGARASLRELGREVIRLGDTALKIQVLETFHRYFIRAGDGRYTARLLGAHEALLRAAGGTTHDAENEEYQRTLAEVRSTIPPEVWDAEVHTGREATSSDVLSGAIDRLDAPEP